MTSLPPGYTLQTAETPEDLKAFAQLAVDYSQWLGVDLRFQAFEAELASLPGCYSRPNGCILLLHHQPAGASEPRVAVGCVALRPLEANHTAGGGSSSTTTTTQQGQHVDEACQQPSPQQQQPDLSCFCEMKRLWVSQEHRGRGLGKALAEAAVAAAVQRGKKHMLLDTLEKVSEANALYKALGFKQREAYYHNPLPGVVYWQLDLV